jgi:hypothetical protein
VNETIVPQLINNISVSPGIAPAFLQKIPVVPDVINFLGNLSNTVKGWLGENAFAYLFIVFIGFIIYHIIRRR